MKKNGRKRQASRRGGIAVMVAAVIAMLLILAAFAVNVAFMQLVREQLRIACDSASKAALVNLGATQNESAAIAFAQSVSEHNLVAGKTPQIAASNIVFGSAVADSYGAYTFTPGATPLNSVQVTGTVTRPLFLQTFVPVGSFTSSQVSVATRISHDVCLVLDRSASMAFDLSSSEFSYPADVSALGNPLQIYFTPPSANGSRWQALTVAVDSFIATLQARNLDVHVALVTYAEDFSFGTFSATDASLDVPLTSNFTLVGSTMDAWGRQALVGNTNIEAGLSMAVAELTGGRARTTADRTIILLTDGVPTTGNSDIASLTLNDRLSSQIVTHVITFGAQASSGAYQSMMMNAADNGNGMYFNAPTATQLQQAFQKIADSLPAVLIKQ